MFDINSLPKTFLGANSAGGFCSYFGNSYNPDDGWRAYIIKGGPGTGKSSLMKQTAAIFADRGESVEICPCSSDPDSLDAVILPDRKVAIMDGTAPHVVEPQFPGVCEKIINLGECWDGKQFLGCEREVIGLTRQNKQLHARASRYITAAGCLMREQAEYAAERCDVSRLTNYAERLAARTIKRGDGAAESMRFLGGITPKGVIFWKTTVNKLCDTVICVCDAAGAVSDLFMHTVRNEALARGQKIITCFNPLCPEQIDHILIPSLRLGFCTEGAFSHPDGVTRRIHARRFYTGDAVSQKRALAAFNRRAADELLREAVKLIDEAKSCHDLLESYYIAAMDFEAVGRICESTVNEILSNTQP